MAQRPIVRFADVSRGASPKARRFDGAPALRRTGPLARRGRVSGLGAKTGRRAAALGPELGLAAAMLGALAATPLAAWIAASADGVAVYGVLGLLAPTAAATGFAVASYARTVRERTASSLIAGAA